MGTEALTNPAERMNTREVAEALNVTEATVRGWRLRDVGPKWFKIGGRVFYMRADLDRYVREAYAQGGGEA